MRAPTLISVFLLTGILTCSPAIAQSDNAIIQYTPGDGVSLKKADATIRAWTTCVLQGTPDSNANGNGGQFGESWIGYLSLEKKFKDTARIYLEFQSGLGQTIQNDLKLLSQVNYNAYDVGGNIKIRRYFYEQYFCDHQVTFLIGREDPRNVIDQVKYASSDDTQFLSYLFNVSPAIDWPSDYTFTAHVNISPKAVNFLEFEYNYMEGDADWQKIQQDGIHTFQINFKPAKLLGLDESKWDGNYRFYSWLNTQPHIKLSDQSSGPSTTTKDFNYGFGIGIDQALGEVFGIFCRLGLQRPEILPVNKNTPAYIVWSGGGQMTGRYWRRENDILGLAVGQLFPSKQWIRSANDHYGAGEGHVEVYYNFVITSYMRIGPDFQIIWNPSGGSKGYQGNSDPIFVYGARLNVVF